MCYACYEEEGSPRIINDQTRHAAEQIRAVFDINHVGGNCHNVVDDFNVDDDTILWCLNEGLRINIHQHTPDELKVEKECLEGLLELTVDERASALALYEGWIELPVE